MEILAIVDNAMVGSVGIDAVGSKYKVCYRAEFGIGIAKGFWGLGGGRALKFGTFPLYRWFMFPH